MDEVLLNLKQASLNLSNIIEDLARYNVLKELSPLLAIRGDIDKATTKTIKYIEKYGKER